MHAPSRCDQRHEPDDLLTNTQMRTQIEQQGHTHSQMTANCREDSPWSRVWRRSPKVPNSTPKKKKAQQSQWTPKSSMLKPAPHPPVPRFSSMPQPAEPSLKLHFNGSITLKNNLSQVSNVWTTIWGMRTAEHVQGPMKQTNEGSHCHRMWLGTYPLTMSIVPSLYRFNFDFCTISLPNSTHLNEYILLIVLALYRFNFDFCTHLNEFILCYCLYLLYDPGSNHVSPNINMGSLGSSPFWHCEGWQSMACVGCVLGYKFQQGKKDVFDNYLHSTWGSESMQSHYLQ